MIRYDKQELGRCDFVDVLEESVLMHSRVRVELVDGTVFEDRIRDVVTHDGVEEVVFESHEPLRLRELVAISREPLPHTYRRDPRRDPDTLKPRT